MSATDFFAMQPANKDAWGHKAYDEFIEQFFFTQFLGKGGMSVIDHITELTKNSKGEAGAWLHCVLDIHGGGIFGDNTAEGRERSLEASWIRANFDQLRNPLVTKGRLSDQKSVINARKEFRKKTARWLAETLEEQAILTASGIGYGFNTDGSIRVTPGGQDPWTDLAYAADVTPPSAGRHLRWDVPGGGSAPSLVDGDTSQVANTDLPSYGLVAELEAVGAEKRLTPVRIDGEDYLIWLISKRTMAQLWKDSDFRQVVVNGETRGSKNPIFRGSKVTMNNIIIKPYLRVYNTKGAAAGSKWGAGNVDGTRSLLMGQQALGFVDLGAANWEEDTRDFKNRWALCVDKMCGWIKPSLKNSHTGTVEDVGVIAVDLAI